MPPSFSVGVVSALSPVCRMLDFFHSRRRQFRIIVDMFRVYFHAYNMPKVKCYRVPIRDFMKGIDKFPIQKCAIFRKFKEIGGIARRHTAVCRTSDSADLSAPGVIDAEIAEKGHLWPETT
jgi:hypothetical protein